MTILIDRAGFQLLTNALDPTFSLSSDFYYRSLLAKVFDWESNMLSFPLTIPDLREGEGDHQAVLRQ